MEKGFTLLLSWMRKTALPFMISIMVLCVIGSLTGSQIDEVSSLFHENSLCYQGVFQLFFLSLIIGGINTVFDDPGFMKKTLLMYKNIVRILIIVIMTIGYAWCFVWFPVESIQAWISFLVTFGVCIGVSITISLYLAHKKNQEYQALLKKYKERGQIDERNQHSEHS